MATCRRVMPPDLVIALICPGNNLIRLRLVEIAKNKLAQAARDRRYRTGIGVELVHSHPVGDVVSCYRSGGGDNGYAVVDQVETPYIGWSKVLHDE